MTAIAVDKTTVPFVKGLSSLEHVQSLLVSTAYEEDLRTKEISSAKADSKQLKLLRSVERFTPPSSSPLQMTLYSEL